MKSRLNVVFAVIGVLVIMIAPIGADEANPVAPVNIPPETSLLPHQLRITKYPGDNCSFKIETSRSLVIITDPCDMNEEVQPDIVTVSHSHDDHADFSHLKGFYQLLNTVRSAEIKGVKITAIAGHHNKGDTETTNIIYVFDLEGLRLAQFASQGDRLTEEMFRQIGTVDILIIQIYGAIYQKFSPSQAFDITQRVQAKLVIPAHGDPKNTDFLINWIKSPSEKIASGQMIVSKKELDELPKTKVVSLDVFR